MRRGKACVHGKPLGAQRLDHPAERQAEQGLVQLEAELVERR